MRKIKLIDMDLIKRIGIKVIDVSEGTAVTFVKNKQAVYLDDKKPEKTKLKIEKVKRFPDTHDKFFEGLG